MKFDTEYRVLFRSYSYQYLAADGIMKFNSLNETFYYLYQLLFAYQRYFLIAFCEGTIYQNINVTESSIGCVKKKKQNFSRNRVFKALYNGRKPRGALSFAK